MCITYTSKYHKDNEREDLRKSEYFHNKIKNTIQKFLKNKYCLDVTNIDYLVNSIISQIISALDSEDNCENLTCTKAGKKWYDLSGIKTPYKRHSVYGFCRSLDRDYYVVIMSKKNILSKFKKFILRKMFLWIVPVILKIQY